MRGCVVLYDGREGKGAWWDDIAGEEDKIGSDEAGKVPEPVAALPVG